MKNGDIAVIQNVDRVAKVFVSVRGVVWMSVIKRCRSYSPVRQYEGVALDSADIVVAEIV